MKRRLVALLLPVVSLAAHADIYTRVDPGGLVVISNVAPPNGTAAAQPQRAAGKSSSVHAAAMPVAFPRVSLAEQRSRDADRRAILQDELAAEQRAFAAAQDRRAGADELHRHRLNIDALQRELRTVP